MSVLLVDLGNTRWKFSVARGRELGGVYSGGYRNGRFPVSALTAHAKDLETVQGVCLASVANPAVTQLLVSDLDAKYGFPVRQVTATQALPNVRSGYRRPEQLGVDRLVAMVAARAQSESPLCVIDAGTAVTVDFVESDGQHLGGFILPGVCMFRDCLLANTAISRDNDVTAGDALGRDTPTAVALGVRHAVGSIVERFLTGSRALFGDRRADVFIGGGDADLFIDVLPESCTKLEHLVLKGLAVIASSGEG